MLKYYRRVDLRQVLRLFLAVLLWVLILYFGYLIFAKKPFLPGTFGASGQDVGGQVGGEATSEARRTSGLPSPSSLPEGIKPQEKIKFTAVASNLPQFILGSQSGGEKPKETVKEEPKGPEKQEILPYLTKWEEEGRFDLKRGTVKFSVVANWQYTVDEVLVLLNFNGQDVRNLFKIAGSNNTIVFDTYDKDGLGSRDELNYYVGREEEYKGKRYDIKFTWDFEAEKPIKRLYVNGQHIADSYPELLPTESGGGIYFGNVADFVITDKWESI